MSEQWRIAPFFAHSAIGLLLAALLFAAGVLLPSRAADESGTTAPPAADADPIGAPVAGASLDSSIAYYRARIGANPDDWRALASLGVAYVQKSRVGADPTYYGKAQGVLTQSLEINETDNFQAMLGMGALGLARHDFAGALEWGRRAASLNPYNAQARAVIGDAFVELGRYSKARQAFQKMVNLRPDLSSYSRVSYLRELYGDVPGAIRAMKLALGSAAGGADAAWIAHQLGDLYFNSGRLEPAESSYRQGAALAQDYLLPRVGLARVAAARGDSGEAISILEQVVDTYPAPDLVILLGDLQSEAGDTVSSENSYELARAIAALYSANGANTDLETALFDADHRFQVASALERARAEYRLRKSIHVADALAWTLYANERFHAARRYSLQALRLGTKNALFEFHAGMIALELGRTREARHHLLVALDINPHFSVLHSRTAKQALASLERS